MPKSAATLLCWLLLLEHATDHQVSTMRRRARILIGVHPRLRLGGCWQAATSFPGRLQMNNMASSRGGFRGLPGFGTVEVPNRP
jgi:hypothetical protein